MRILICLFFLLGTHNSFAQTNTVKDGSPVDSVTISFEPNDSLQTTNHKLDTTGCKLWQIGSTSKTFFTTGLTSLGAIMTDTSQPYDTSRNESFTLRLNSKAYNLIIGFWHKYEMDSSRDGGIVEYSTDTGATWNNVTGDCHILYIGGGFGMRTDNFYNRKDTLLTGEPAFTGNSNGWRYSRMQLFNYVSVKGTALKCIGYNDIMYRFRFVSDATQNNKAGWIIDRIQIEYDSYGSSVAGISNPSLQIYPIPTSNGVVNFPELQNQSTYRIIITDITGKKMIDIPYTNIVNIAACQQGIYYYKVSNEEVVYTGKLVKH